jgi:general secretion pathway protein K
MKPAMRGAALLLVLWLLVLLIGLLGVFALTARTEGLQAHNLARSSAARYAAEGGAELAVLRLLSGDETRRWIPDGRAYRYAYEDFQLEVRIVDETGKIDLNAATPDLLVGLLRAVGVAESRAQALAAAIVDFRDSDDLLNAGIGAEDREYAAAGLPYGAKDGSIVAVAELQQVLGMDAALYEHLRPYLTVHSGQVRPNEQFAPGPVLQAMGLVPEQVAAVLAGREPAPGAAPDPVDAIAPRGTGTYSISSRATRSDGTQARITVTLRMGGNGVSGSLYTPLAWLEGDSY